MRWIRRQKSETDAEIAHLETRLAQITVSPPPADMFLEDVWAKIEREAASRERIRRPRILRPALTLVAVAGVVLIGLLLYRPLLRPHSTIHVVPQSDQSVRLTPPISPSVKDSEIDVAALFPDLWNLSGGLFSVPVSQPGNHKTRQSTRRHRARSPRIQLVTAGKPHEQYRDRRQASLAWKQVSGLVRGLPARLHPDVGLVRAVWQRQAARLETEGRYAEASTTYGCIFRLHREPGIAFAAGRTAEAAGNIENAVAYYAQLLN